MSRREELTDEQWSLIEPLFDKTEAVQTRGRPRREDREIFNGVLWILRSGARWADLPGRFPHKQNRKRAKTQDGRKLRRYKRRWKIERLFAWLQNFRRVLVRFDYHDANYLGFVHLACIVILLRNYF